MAQPAFDDSVEKLEGFCNLLGQTIAVLTRDVEGLGARAESLDQTEAETRKRGEEVAQRLASELDDLTAAHEDAIEEADRLTEVAQDLAATRLPAAEDRLQSAESSVEERTSQEEAGLEKAFLDLFESGFTALATVIDEVEAELRGAGEGAREALEGLERGQVEVGQAMTETGGRTATALGEAERVAAEDASRALEQEGAEHSALWTEELPEAVRAECASVGEPLEALYREWEGEVATEGDELSEGVADLLADAAVVVASQAGQLAAAVREAIDDSLAALAGQQDVLVPTLTEGEPASEAAAALVDDLAVARQVVSEIDRLLRAIAE